MKNKELKKCLKLLIEVSEKVIEMIKTKKLSWMFFVRKAPAIIYFAKNIGDAVEQFKNMTEAQRMELEYFFQKEFEIPNKEAEKKVYMAFGQFTKLIGMFGV